MWVYRTPAIQRLLQPATSPTPTWRGARQHRPHTPNLLRNAGLRKGAWNRKEASRAPMYPRQSVRTVFMKTTSREVDHRRSSTQGEPPRTRPSVSGPWHSARCPPGSPTCSRAQKALPAAAGTPLPRRPGRATQGHASAHGHLGCFHPSAVNAGAQASLRGPASTSLGADTELELRTAGELCFTV